MQLELVRDIKEVKKLGLVIYPVFDDKKSLTRLLTNLKIANSDGVWHRLKKEKFEAKSGQNFSLVLGQQCHLFIGLGRNRRLTAEDSREAMGNVVIFLKNYQSDDFALIAGQWVKAGQDVSLFAQALAEGLYLGQYIFDKYKKADKSKIKVNLLKVFVQVESNQKRKFLSGWQKGELLAQGTNLARDLVNEPAHGMTPTALAECAQGIAKANKNISVRVYDEAKARQLGMGAFLGIDKGSPEPLKFIHLIYKPKVKTKNKLAIVGKGITFDSGGLNLKPDQSMLDMKMDMAGAAAVLGIFSVVSKLAPDCELHGIIAACENMPSGTAIKPGDIVRNMQGKTIEIANTDAEGRVTLADALAYAQKQGAKTVIDLATLTGAVMVALGSDYAGLFSNNEKLAQALEKSAEFSGEKLWRLPLPVTYKKLNDSKVADIRNIPSSRYGGAITAALFLQEFINDDVAWAHLDIAGPAYAEKALASYLQPGGVGYGVRTILNWLGK